MYRAIDVWPPFPTAFPSVVTTKRFQKIFEFTGSSLEITPSHYAGSGMPRPRPSMVESSLFAPREPQLVQELLEEMRSADTVDILVSFIKWSGLRAVDARV